MHIVEKILNNTTPYGKIRASHEGSLHSSTLTQVMIVHYMLMIFLSVINLNICIQSSVNFSNVLIKFSSGPWRTVLNSPKTKTQCMHFCKLRGLHNDPVLKLDGVEIPVVEQYKFLGVIFDRKLSFIPHINYLKAKCHKALQLLRVVAHTDWGADKSTLLKLYKSLVRSKLDYGCFIYGSARKSYLRCLDSIHHLGLRLALGALRTSPVESLYVEANEAPLSLRREKLALQYYTKL